MTRTALSACILLAVLSAAVGTHSAAAESGSQQFAGRTTLVAQAAASKATVRLATDVELPGRCINTQAASYSGSAAGAMIVLTRLPYRRGDLVQYFARLPGSGTLVDSFCAGRTLAAGDYEVVVLRTAGTAKWTLSLPGLQGSFDVALPSGSDAVLRELPMASPAAVARATANFGASLELVSAGNTIVAGSILASGPASLQAIGTCEYEPGSTPPPEPIAFSPPCPTAASSRTVTASSVEAYFSASATAPQPGTYRLGFYYAGSGDLRSGGVLAAAVPAP